MSQPPAGPPTAAAYGGRPAGPGPVAGSAPSEGPPAPGYGPPPAGPTLVQDPWPAVPRGSSRPGPQPPRGHEPGAAPAGPPGPQPTPFPGPHQLSPHQQGPAQQGLFQQDPSRPGRYEQAAWPHDPPPSGPSGPSAATGRPNVAPDGAHRSPATRTTLTAGLLQAAAVVLVPLGAGVPFGADFAGHALWSTTTTWAAFALLAAIVQLAPVSARLQQRAPEGAWRTGAVGVAGLVAFWVLIVLPGVSSGPSFVLTMGTVAAALGLWLSPGRPR